MSEPTATDSTEAELAAMGLKMLRDLIGDIVVRANLLRHAPDPMDRDNAQAIHDQASLIYRALGKMP